MGWVAEREEERGKEAREKEEEGGRERSSPVFPLSLSRARSGPDDGRLEGHNSKPPNFSFEASHRDPGQRRDGRVAQPVAQSHRLRALNLKVPALFRLVDQEPFEPLRFVLGDEDRGDVRERRVEELQESPGGGEARGRDRHVLVDGDDGTRVGVFFLLGGGGGGSRGGGSRGGAQEPLLPLLPPSPSQLLRREEAFDLFERARRRGNAAKVEGHPPRDQRAPVASLHAVPLVLEDGRHQRVEAARHGPEAPARLLLRGLREAEAGQRGHDDVEGLRRGVFWVQGRSAGRHGEELDDGARPAVEQEERQRRRRGGPVSVGSLVDEVELERGEDARGGVVLLFRREACFWFCFWLVEQTRLEKEVERKYENRRTK